MKREDIGSSLFWLLLGAGVTYAGWDLGLGKLRDPGPGFMLFWVGLIMVGLSLAIGLAALRRAPRPPEPLWAGTRWWKIVLVVAALVGYAYALERLGFFLTTVLVLIFLFKAIEPQRWTVAVAGAVLTALAAYGLFNLWLGAQLPRGALFG